MPAPGTSLILSWDNPVSLWDPIGHTCQVWRTLKPMIAVLIGDNVTWGFFVDKENADPAAEYFVTYLDGNKSPVVHVLNPDIKRYARPDTICEITFNRTQQDGSPDSGREITCSNEVGGSGDWSKTVLTNADGKACFFAMPGSRLLMRIQGDTKALDFVVPDLRIIDSRKLLKYGTLVDIDPRRSIGWNNV